MGNSEQSGVALGYTDMLPAHMLFCYFAVVTNPVLEHVQKFCENTVSIELSFVKIKEVCTGVFEF